jgi:hypothetical protein
VQKFNFTTDEIRLKYQERASTYSSCSTLLSVALILGSGVLYLMGHDSVGLATSAQLVYIYYKAHPPATVDLQAWGSHGYPAVLAMPSDSSPWARWMLPAVIYCLVLIAGGVFQELGLNKFKNRVTTSGAENMI